MTSELVPWPGDAGQVQPLVRGGADLVHLAEELYLRLYALVAILMLGGGGLALWLGGPAEGTPPSGVTFVCVAICAAIAALALAKPVAVYRWLRYDRIHQLAPAALAVVLVIVDGPDSPSWWVALPLLWMVAVVSSTTVTAAAATAVGIAFLAPTVATGMPLIHGGDTELLAEAAALPVNTCVGRLAVEVFARFVLNFSRLQHELTGERPAALTTQTAAAAPAPSEPRPPQLLGAGRPPRRAKASRLTARQLEVAMLTCDGLMQSEIAVALGISPRQVERLMHDARERVGAATSSQLVAMLVAGRLVPSDPEEPESSGDPRLVIALPPQAADGSEAQADDVSSAGADDVSSAGADDVSSAGADDVSSAGADDVSSARADDVSSARADDVSSAQAAAPDRRIAPSEHG